MKEKLSKFLPYFTLAFILLMLASLQWGWLDPFFFGAEHYHVQGIDYFAVPKSYLNLLEGKSAFDTWAEPHYGPYATWYLAHPAFSVFVASWFSFFNPWTSYWLFVFFSIAIMVYSAYLISKTTDNKTNKRIAFFVILCAFPTYWIFYTGNMHAPLVLALTLILLGIYDFTYSNDDNKANKKLLAGLLISFFTKPIALLMLPVLLLMKETRKTTIRSIFIYVVVSLLFIVIPALNPQSIGWHKLMNVAFDFDFIKENMNIYKNNLVLNDYMRDNSIHWLNLIAQSDYKLQHIDVYSLPVFMDMIVGHSTSASIYKLPIILCLILSVGIACIDDKKIRLESTLLLVMAISLTFFLSYNTVWEYQFSSVLPIIALLPILKSKDVFYKKSIPLLFLTGLFFCLPSLYFIVKHFNFTRSVYVTIIRLDRVIPAVIIFLVMIVQLIKILKKEARFKMGKKISITPKKLFFE